jgi:hypothetical protein
LEELINILYTPYVGKIPNVYIASFRRNRYLKKILRLHSPQINLSEEMARILCPFTA